VLKFAVCNDNSNELATIKQLFDRYTAEKGIPITAEYYSDRKQIVRLLPYADEYDCLFLDVYMEELNGIDIARHLRKNQNQSNIVFFTASRDHAIEAFSLNALHYVVKPLSYADVEETIRRIIRAKKEQQACIHLTNGRDVVRIGLDDFMYSEAQKHYQHIYLTNGTIEKARMTCLELSGRLEGHPEFVRCGASYIINLKFIARITATDVYLLDGRRVPIPRRSSVALKRKYGDYFLGESDWLC